MTDVARSAAAFLALLEPNIGYDNPRSTILQSQTARDLIVSLALIANNTRIVDGTTYPATRAGIAAAVVDAAADAGSNGNGTVRIVTDITLDSTAIPPLNNVTVINEATLTAPPGAVAGAMFTYTGVFSSIGTLASGANRGTRTFTLNAGQVASLGIAAGDYLHMRDVAFTVRNQIVHVLSIAGDVVQLYDALDFNFIASDQVVKFNTYLKNFAFINKGLLDCTGNTGVYHGVTVFPSVFSEFSMGQSKGFSSGSVLQDLYSYGSRHHDAFDVGSGDNGYAAYEAIIAYGLSVQNVRSDSNGFGYLLEWAHGTGTSILNTGGLLGRLIKLNCNSYFTLSESEGSGNRGPYTGIMISGVFYKNLVVNCRANGNLGYGIQTGGSGGDGVDVVNCEAENNTTADILFSNGDANTGLVNPISKTGSIYLLSEQMKVKGLAQVVTTSGATPGAFPTLLLYGKGTYFLHGKVVASRTDRVVTITIAAPGVVTWTGHGLTNGLRVGFTTTGALPTGLVPYDANNPTTTTYFVVNAAANTFELSLTNGGVSINTTGTQSGVHTIQAPSAGAAYTVEIVSRGSLTAPDFNVQDVSTVTVINETIAAYALAAVVTGGGLFVTGTGIAGHTTNWQVLWDIEVAG